MHTMRLRSTALSLALCGLSAVGCAADTSESDLPHHGSTDALSESVEALACKKPIPASLAVPEGTHLAFSLLGRGTQNYACKQAADGSFAWTFIEPEAILYGPLGWRLGHHFAGPTWEANDGSTVVGSKLAGETVDATAIPWLLLQAKSHTGQGFMAKITYVQRLDTVGGLAPTSGCDAAHADTTADVAYTAKYSFYR